MAIIRNTLDKDFNVALSGKNFCIKPGINNIDAEEKHINSLLISALFLERVELQDVEIEGTTFIIDDENNKKDIIKKDITWKLIDQKTFDNIDNKFYNNEKDTENKELEGSELENINNDNTGKEEEYIILNIEGKSFEESKFYNNEKDTEPEELEGSELENNLFKLFKEDDSDIVSYIK